MKNSVFLNSTKYLLTILLEFFSALMFCSVKKIYENAARCKVFNGFAREETFHSKQSFRFSFVEQTQWILWWQIDICWYCLYFRNYFNKICKILNIYTMIIYDQYVVLFFNICLDHVLMKMYCCLCYFILKKLFALVICYGCNFMKIYDNDDLTVYLLVGIFVLLFGCWVFSGSLSVLRCCISVFFVSYQELESNLVKLNVNRLPYLY